jgi:hypothetical protein
MPHQIKDTDDNEVMGDRLYEGTLGQAYWARLMDQLLGNQTRLDFKTLGVPKVNSLQLYKAVIVWQDTKI